jgi:hypothetical protein
LSTASDSVKESADESKEFVDSNLVFKTFQIKRTRRFVPKTPGEKIANLDLDSLNNPEDYSGSCRNE